MPTQKSQTADSIAARTERVGQPVIGTLPKPPASPPNAAHILGQTGPAATRIPGKSAAEQIAIEGTGFSPAMKKALGQS